MSAPIYMKLYVADYLADTTHLTTREHGAYLLLLMAMWRAGGKLPANDAKLAKIAKCSASEWAQMRPAILAFFRRRGASLSHKRLAKELDHARTVSCNRQRGVNRSYPKNPNDDNTKGPANRGHLKGKSPHIQKQIVGTEGSNEPSAYYPRERADEQPGGSSASRVVELHPKRKREPPSAYARWRAARYPEGA